MKDAKYPLMSSVQHWFRLSFCTPFLALHSSARNHATQFSMFFSSSKNLKNVLLFFTANVSHTRLHYLQRISTNAQYVTLHKYFSGLRCSQRISTSAQYVILHNYFSHPSLVISFFATPSIRLKEGLQIGENY